MALGIGAMLHHLGGGSENSADKYYGRTITDAAMDKEENRLRIEFSDGVRISIWDDGQSCCESRYMTTDDDLSPLAGSQLIGITVKPGKAESEYGDHEIAFVEVATNSGFITIANHNEHNGYYGGFGLTITEDKSQ